MTAITAIAMSSIAVVSFFAGMAFAAWLIAG